MPFWGAFCVKIIVHKRHPKKAYFCNSPTARDASFVQYYARIDADTLNADHVGEDRNVWKVHGSVDLNQHGDYMAQRDQSRGQSLQWTSRDDSDDNDFMSHGHASSYGSNAQHIYDDNAYNNASHDGETYDDDGDVGGYADEYNDEYDCGGGGGYYDY